MVAIWCLSWFSSFGQTIKTVAGNGVLGYTGDGGMATAATTNYPGDVVVDASGNIYFSEYNNNRVRKVSAAGILTTVAGTGTAGFGGDGGAATAAKLYQPYGLALDTAGNLFVADCGNNRVRKISPMGVISTYAGQSSFGFLGDGGAATAAKLWIPTYVVADIAGNIYITDNQNQRIRKVTASTGIITTVVGNGTIGYTGDGGAATAASLNYPGQISIDTTGAIYIAGGLNYAIRKVNAAGIISTIAGTGTSGFSGDGGSATLAEMGTPLGMCVDNAGNVYFSDENNYRIRKISVSGTISTLAGNGTAAFAGDGGPSTAAEVNDVDGMRTDMLGNLYIADAFNYRVREIVFDAHAPAFASGHHQSFSVCGDTSARPINSYLSVNDPDLDQMETWTLIGGPYHGSATVSYSTLSTGTTITPTGLSYTPATGFVGTDSFRVTVSDGWFSDTTTIVVTVLPAPNPGIVVGPDSFCTTGETGIIYTDSIAGGSWSLTNTAIASIGATTGVLISSSGGMDTVVYTVGGTCGPVAAKKAIHIVPVLVLPAITGPAWVCIGDSIALADSFLGGTWNCTNTSAAISSPGKVVGITPGKDTVNFTASNLCGPVTVTKPITVYSTLQCDSALQVVPVSAITKLALKLAPNPAENVVEIELVGTTSGNTRLRVLNDVGQHVYETMENCNHFILQVSGYTPGVYFLQITNGGTTFYAKFQKI